MVTPVSRIKEFTLPDLGEGLTEGEILSWLVAEGDIIELNQPIVEIETAKAAVEIPAKWAGRVAKIFHPEGSTIEVGTPIIAIDTDPSTPAADGGGPSEAVGASNGSHGAERTAVLVGYGPRTGAAPRRPRHDAAPPPTPPGSKGTVQAD
jgi:pyruvate dehydrogenase E2 component (dihydrolipoamide acetyltransferase)